MSATVLILGATGVIGSEIAAQVQAAGYRVRGLARHIPAGKRAVGWIAADAGRMDAAAWAAALDGVDVVVNAAGALQDGPRDDLEAVHVTLVRDMVAAIGARPVSVVQISAAGVDPDATTVFFRTKAAGDAILRASGVRHVILRPGMVLAPQAYGGTALLRAAAALPGILPVVLPETRIQTVHVADVARAAHAAVRGDVAWGLTLDLMEEEAHSLPDIIAAMREWLGFPRGSRLTIPAPCVTVGGHVADVAGWLRWPSPLRTTSLEVLRDGVTGTPSPDFPCRPLATTLADLPSTAQERRFARTWFLLPLAVVTLSLFWIASGVIALSDPAKAAMVLEDVPGMLARSVVVGGGIADIALGLAILWRPTARLACIGMAALSSGYLLGGAMFAPALWLDPLGPMVKVFPGIVLALLIAALLEER